MHVRKPDTNPTSTALRLRHYDLTSPINQLQSLKNPSKGQKLRLRSDKVLQSSCLPNVEQRISA